MNPALPGPARRTTGLGALALLLPLAAAAEPLAVRTEAAVETEGTAGDADDPAIWVDPEDAADSLILGADKTAGLYVYGLDGMMRDFLPGGELNNVDLRPFTIGGRDVALVGATRRDDETLVFYVIEDGAVRPAVPWQHAAIPPDAPEADDIYGFAMGEDEGGTYAIVNFKTGHVAQYRLREAQGTLALDHVRTLRVGSQPEGMVVDDAAGHLYVGEEDVGIWRYPLSGGAEATAVATIPSDCLPRDDVEGLAIFDGPEGRFLVASAQGINRAALYRLDGHALPACVALVEVAPGALDAVTETDGLEVTAQPLGAAFPRGLLVMMDDQNAGFTTNFKLVPWDAVGDALAR